MSVWTWVQVAVVIIVAIASYFVKGINKWLGFGMIAAAGILMIVMSVVLHDFRFLGFGILAILAVAVALIDQATGEPKADDDTLGGQISNLHPWAIVVIVVLFIGAVVPLFVLKPPVSAGANITTPETSEQSQQLEKHKSTKEPPKTPPKK